MCGLTVVRVSQSVKHGRRNFLARIVHDTLGFRCHYRLLELGFIVVRQEIHVEATKNRRTPL